MIIKKTVSGWQILAHRIRMTRQVLKIAFFIALGVFAIRMAYKTYQLDKFYWRCGTSLIKNLFISNSSPTTVQPDFWQFLTPYSQVDFESYFLQGRRLYVGAVRKLIYNKLGELKRAAIKKIPKEIVLFLLSVLAVLVIGNIRGQRLYRKQILSGKSLKNPLLTSWKLRLTGKASAIKLGRLHLPKGFETTHTLITGRTGTGKTNCIHHFLQAIRKKNQSAIIVDTEGTFVEKYFDPERDILLNPIDTRRSHWNIFDECDSSEDFDMLAASFLPANPSFSSDSYWMKAARAVLASVLRKGRKEKNIEKITEMLRTGTNLEIAKFANVAAHLDADGQAAGVRGNMDEAVRALQYLENPSKEEKSFSIKKWVNKKDKRGSWLFLFCDPNSLDTFRPLLGAWFSIAAKAIKGLEPSDKRRLWFVIDELANLAQLDGLTSFLDMARKKGGCGLLATQNLGQLQKIYSKEDMHGIVDNCATRVAFCTQDPQFTRMIAESFGKIEFKENNEGTSHSANTVGDRVNLNSVEKNKNIVAEAELSNLAVGEAFIKVPTAVCKVKLKFLQIANPSGQVVPFSKDQEKIKKILQKSDKLKTQKPTNRRKANTKLEEITHFNHIKKPKKMEVFLNE